jgi:hypothetical protein
MSASAVFFSNDRSKFKPSPNLPRKREEERCVFFDARHNACVSQPVRLENEVLRIEVWPRLGGKVSSVLDKADGFELLFNYPAEIPTVPYYGKSYDSTWYAGWDECFPAVGAGPYVGHPYDHIPIPDHGEVYSIPVTTAVPSANGITTVWNGLRFGYRLTRKLTLTSTGLSAAYTVTNHAPFEFRYVWAQHALFSMESEVELDLPGASSMRWSHTVGDDIQKPFDWPVLDGEHDFSKPSRLRTGAWKVFGLDPIASAAVLRYPQRKRSLSISYSGASPAYWGVWINSGAWNHQRQLAVEPTTGRFDQLDRSVSDGSAGRIDPGATQEWRCDWVVGDVS